jgi:two-component system KDP operon response regulator KdpE
MKNTILVVDSEPQTFKILNLVLDADEFRVEECPSGKHILRMCVTLQPDIILLDVNLPDIAGLEIIRSIREWSKVPIIILSTHMTNKDVIDGLNSGADDYVLKPFNADVLRARIYASLRKSATQEAGAPELVNGPLRVDLVRHQIYLDDELIAFTPKEYNLLRYFITHCGKMLSHRDILQEVWGKAHSADTQYLRVFIGQIRKKIEKNPSVSTIITTEPGIGYRMELLQAVTLVNMAEPLLL